MRAQCCPPEWSKDAFSELVVDRCPYGEPICGVQLLSRWHQSVGQPDHPGESPIAGRPRLSKNAVWSRTDECASSTVVRGLRSMPGEFCGRGFCRAWYPTKHLLFRARAAEVSPRRVVASTSDGDFARF